VGLILGLALALAYTWIIDPLVLRNAAPGDLSPAAQQQYVAAAALEYGATGDLQRAVARLIEANPEADPFQLAAETACQLIRGGQVDSLNDVAAIRYLRAIYEPQGYTADCDVTAFNTPIPITIVPPTATMTFTPSLTPFPSKTPTKAIQAPPAATPIVPNAGPSAGGDFQAVLVEAYCDPASSGLLEVYVRDEAGGPVAGIPIQVVDSSRQAALFYTGLKPERGLDYADFQMTAGASYRVGIAEGGLLSSTLDAIPCDTAGTLNSYRVVLQGIPPDEEEE
jgi:hypothetical protein